MKTNYRIAIGLLIALAGPAAAQAAGNYCLKQWPGDRDAYSTCVNLQNRNRLDYQLFLKKNGVQPENVARAAASGNPVARIARFCRTRWYPNFKQVWQCTQRNVEAMRKQGGLD